MATVIEGTKHAVCSQNLRPCNSVHISLDRRVFPAHLGAQIFSGRSRAVDFNQILARVLFSATGCRKDDDFWFRAQRTIRSGDDDFNARPSPNWGISLSRTAATCLNVAGRAI